MGDNVIGNGADERQGRVVRHMDWEIRMEAGLLLLGEGCRL